MQNSYPALYQQIWGRNIDVSSLIVEFSALPDPDPNNPLPAAALADKFFEKYGVGNTLSVVDRPYERMHAYEILLDQLFQHDKSHFQGIHKGTPYYFLGWTAFQIENFEKGIFYFDQGMMEDIRKSPGQTLNILKANPAVGAFLLDPQLQSGVAIALELLHKVEDEINNFASSSRLPINKTNFVDDFISPNFFQNEFRTIVTSIYSFILEYSSVQKQLDIRSIGGGSLEPFFIHLFKGGLILESLLKLKSPPSVGTLYRAINHNKTDLIIDMTKLKSGSLQEIVDHFNDLRNNSASYQDICFVASYGIRNTTGHSLAWADIFQNDQNLYGNLYASILGSIFWTIYKLWIE